MSEAIPRLLGPVKIIRKRSSRSLRSRSRASSAPLCSKSAARLRRSSHAGTEDYAHDWDAAKDASRATAALAGGAAAHSTPGARPGPAVERAGSQLGLAAGESAGGDLTAEERRRQDLFYKRTIDQVAGKLGFDPAKIEVSDASPKFKLNDQEFDYAAAADMQTGKITVYRKHMVLSEASGSLAHEIMHQKFEAAVKSRSGCVRVLRRPWHAPSR